MTGIIDIIKTNNTCVIPLVIFYENRTKNAKKVYRVLSCIFYSVIENYVWDLCCHYKTVSDTSSYKLFENKSYIELLGIGIPEV